MRQVLRGPFACTVLLLGMAGGALYLGRWGEDGITIKHIAVVFASACVCCDSSSGCWLLVVGFFLYKRLFLLCVVLRLWIILVSIEYDVMNRLFPRLSRCLGWWVAY